MANCKLKSSVALGSSATCLLLLTVTGLVGHTSARMVLDEEPAPAVTPSPVETPAAAPAAASDAAAAPTTGVTATTTGGGAAAGRPLTFFMHDILGGSNPSARIVAGIVTNTAVNGQLPFAKPSGAVPPVNGGAPLNNANNGVINNNNNFPFLTGLRGTTTGVIQNNNAVNGGVKGVPFSTGGNLPAGATLEKLLFGTMTVIDDELTEGHEIGSGVVGKAQGFYLASSQDGTSQTMAFTTMFKAGDYADSLSFFGLHRTADAESHVAVVGGTGKYVNAKGYATVQTLHPVDQHATDGMERLLQFTVYLVD